MAKVYSGCRAVTYLLRSTVKIVETPNMPDDKTLDNKSLDPLLSDLHTGGHAVKPSSLQEVQDENVEVGMLKDILVDAMVRISELEKIGRVFHDFNNILSSSMGYATLASERAKDIEDEKLSRYLNNIEKAGVRSRDLVRESLAQRQRFRDRQRCVLGEVLDQALTELMVGAQGVKKHYAEELTLNIAADSARLIFTALVKAISPLSSLILCGEVYEEPHCRQCGCELSGLQLQFVVKSEHTASTTIKLAATDRRLIAAFTDVCGGHFCESLVQDYEIVVYLKVNASQVE